METQQSSRLRTLLQTGLAISSELSLDGVLQRIVEATALVTGARYVALGVIDPTGTSLERFVTHGIDDDTRAVIGDLPRGRGILGALITDARTLRLHDLAEDPRSVGFPPGHPPMRAFLGTPIVLRGVAYGNLYLTEKEGGADFDEEDEELVALLSAQAAVAIENARLYESATAWSQTARVAAGDQRRAGRRARAATPPAARRRAAARVDQRARRCDRLANVGRATDRGDRFRAAERVAA